MGELCGLQAQPALVQLLARQECRYYTCCQVMLINKWDRAYNRQATAMMEGRAVTFMMPGWW